VIACWSRIGNKHTDALLSLMTPTQPDDNDHSIVDNTNNLARNLTKISLLLPQWCTITLAMCIAM
jgi:hypothetical protein